MNLRQLQAIQAVAELGSVTAAASRLGLTQSAVSRMIAAVEADLGLTLFERYRRRLIPGEHTLHFVSRAERILSSMQELEASTRAISEKRADRLRIIAVPPFLQSILPQAITRRVKANSRLSIRIDAARRADIPDWISRRDFDIAVVGLPVDRPEVRVQPLPTVRAVAVLPRGHRLAKHSSVRLQDILAGPLVTQSTGPLLRLALDRTLAGQGLSPTPVIEASNWWQVCGMVAAGAGLGVVDPFTAEAQANGTLVVRPLKELVPLTYGILTFRDCAVVGELAALCEEIHQQVNNVLKSSSVRSQPSRDPAQVAGNRRRR